MRIWNALILAVGALALPIAAGCASASPAASAPATTAPTASADPNGKPLYKTDAQTGEEILDDDIPAVTRNFVKRKEKRVFSVLSGIEFITRDVSANTGLPRRLQFDNHCNFRIPKRASKQAVSDFASPIRT